MEGKDASLHWEWQDELLADLDSESPLATSHTLWEDITQSEADMKGLFETTPASKMKGACTSDQFMALDFKAERRPSVEQMSGESPRHKRRRMLQFEGEEGALYACNPSMEAPSDPLGNYSDLYIAQCEDLHMLEPTSTNSMWYMVDEGPLRSVDDDAERSDDNWMAGYYRAREAEAPPPLESWMARCIEEWEDQGLQNQMSMESPTSNIKTSGNGEFGAGEANTIVLAKPALSGRSMAAKLATPVAYPFAVVKPSGMQGDVTLNDINRRIMMRPGTTRSTGGGGSDASKVAEACKGRGGGGGGGGATAANLSRKSVVALTKIHTEGNGTITIMRTKN